MLDALGEAKWFSSTDLTNGFWQVGMHPDSIQKTAFISREGLFEFNVMPFGVCNGPATFQRAMDDMLGNYNWKFAMVYIDDINIFSRTFEEHLQHLNLVFQRIRKAGLKLNKAKCNFIQKELLFLGHVVNKDGMSPDPSTVQKILDFPQLRTIKGL